MNYVQKLEKWFADERARGLLDCKIFLGEKRDSLREDVAREAFEAVSGERESYPLTEGEL